MVKIPKWVAIVICIGAILQIIATTLTIINMI
nr:MAG TPA: hypothetical protein [Caudoviricetes sp.]DAH40460.1 MAG TPA: hypothetical protein [Caudoviricetes sp.]DAM92536.1 MAG TPA: hypothetical protein [Caudoviricetes sp.]